MTSKGTKARLGPYKAERNHRGSRQERVSVRMREQHSEVPWLDMSDTRNKLIHSYDEVDLDVLWDIVHNDLPPLVVQLEAMLASLED